MSTPRTGLDQMSVDERSGYVTYNEVLRQLQARMNVLAVSVAVATPPETPVDGEVWYVPVGATGAWAGQDKDFAQWYNGEWYFNTPVAGTRFFMTLTAQRAYIDANGDVVTLSDPVTDYQDMVLADSPLAYWPLNEQSGTTALDAAGSADGVVSGTYTQGNAPLVQEGTSYDMTTAKVDVAIGASGTTWSAEVWITPDQLSGYRALIHQSGVGLYLTSSRLSMYFSSDHLSDTTLIVGTRYHVVLSVNAGAGTWYLNGVADGSVSSVPAFNPTALAANTGGSEYYDGTLDQVAFYQSALTAQQVLDHYNQGIGA